MLTTYILAAGIICQLIAVVLAFRLIKLTGRRLAWGMIIFALMLMVFRRGIVFYHVLAQGESLTLGILGACVDLAVSLSMLIGIAGIGPVFAAIKRDQDALRESEVKFRTLADFTFDWEYWGKPDGSYIYISPSCERITGYKPEEFMVDKDLLNAIIHPEDQSFVLQHRELLRPDNRGTHIADFRVVTRSGQVRWISHACQAVLDPKGKSIGRRVSNRDITERKQAEQDLKKAYEELKNTQAQLIQSVKMAAVGQLAGSIVHEIKNPMAGILNNTQLIKMLIDKKEEVRLPDLRDILETIEESTLRCNNVITSLLGLVRVSKGVLQPVQLNALVERVMVIIAKEFKLENIILNKELSPDISNIQGDSQLLQEVILVLVSNAKWAVEKRWNKKDGGAITIKTFKHPQDKSVVLSISDNGIGIAPENIPKLFESFFTTKEEGEGIGLGLALVSNIIQKHEGAIKVESQVNEGTAFKLSFPS